MIMDCIISTNGPRFSNALYVEAVVLAVGDLITARLRLVPCQLEILSTRTNDGLPFVQQFRTPIRLLDLGNERYALKRPIIVAQTGR